MKRILAGAGFTAFFCALISIAAFGQGTTYATVKGACKNAQGAPITDAQIVFLNQDNGRQYKLKTDKKGEFFSLGLEAGQYTVTLTGKDGQVLDSQKGFHLDIGDNQYNVDLKQIQEQNIKETAKQEGVSTEEIKRQQEAVEKAQQRNASVKTVNEKLTAAAAILKSPTPDYEQAIALATQAKDMMPNEDAVWGVLGAAYLDSAQAQTDPAEKAKRNGEAYDDIKKAIDLKTGVAAPPVATDTPAQGSATSGASAAPAAAAAPKPKPASPEDNQHLAEYYGNLGSASARLGKSDEAIKDYQQAADLNPAKAGNYYYNLGIVLHNTAKNNDDRKAAVAAFDKAIAADPTRAEAYYLKGTDMFGQATTDSAGKATAPPGTVEAFQKYLELQPTGSHAEEVKQMLAYLGSTVETGFGKKSTKKK